MKFYETTADEYIMSKEKWNIHPEWKREMFPTTLRTFENMIVYGPSGAGKYSQVLSILKEYSPSELKYEKKMTVQSEKQNYTFRMSDIHYEVDMSFLGCNSKTLWHDIFFQIVDIVSVKADKIGIIVCKQFHMIHSELLEIFYSYMQRLPGGIYIKFILITEHISFLPNNILNACRSIPIKKPSQTELIKMVEHMEKKRETKETFHTRISSGKQKQAIRSETLLKSVDTTLILNMKEIPSFTLVKTVEDFPKDVFNVICDQIIADMENIDKIPFTQFRDSLYDIMIYNLDVIECVWYILSYFSKKMTSNQCSKVLGRVFPFLQYFNNNYRPIYHLENIMFYIITVLKEDVENKSTKCSRIKGRI